MAIIETPDSIDVFVPKLGRAVRVPIGTAAEDVVLHLIMHGIKQKLVDSTAGLNPSDYANKDEYSKAVDATVAARLETVLTIPSERAFGPRNPVETEARRIVAELLLKWKVVTKRAAALEATSTYAKAADAFNTFMAKAVCERNPNATSSQVLTVVDRQFTTLVLDPAARIVAERKSVPADLGDLSVE